MIASKAKGKNVYKKPQQVGDPSVPSAVFRGFIEFRCQRRVKVSKCVTSISILDWHICIFCIFELFVSSCHIVTQCDTCVGCHTCVMRQTFHKFQCHVSLISKCVIGHLLKPDLKKVWRREGCQKVIPRSSADYFVVGRRQILNRSEEEDDLD
jgi:hypothetical protein